MNVVKAESQALAGWPPTWWLAGGQPGTATGQAPGVWVLTHTAVMSKLTQLIKWLFLLGKRSFFALTAA